jgi:hypothetical protein
MAKDLTEALRRLTEQAQGQTSRVDKTLPASPTATAIPARAGTGGPPQFKGSGIASPLVETAYSERTFHAATQYASTDGIFVIELLPVKTINFKDALESPVTIEFKAKA